MKISGGEMLIGSAILGIAAFFGIKYFNKKKSDSTGGSGALGGTVGAPVVVEKIVERVPDLPKVNPHHEVSQRKVDHVTTTVTTPPPDQGFKPIAPMNFTGDPLLDIFRKELY